MRLSAFSGTFGHLRAERLGARLGAMSQMSTMRRSASATELRRPAAAPHAAAATAAAPGPPTPALVGRHRLALHFRGHRLALVPSSLWGSASLAVQLTQPATRVLPRSASVVAQVGARTCIAHFAPSAALHGTSACSLGTSGTCAVLPRHRLTSPTHCPAGLLCCRCHRAAVHAAAGAGVRGPS